ncbi:MAG: low molecular weight phosphotyrosine protein phosphatase [Oscillospiraceae bacterium]|nr:low molecular weight phosphotyrosine protein phosphatase [Oscillospiraceae bacterium]
MIKILFVCHGNICRSPMAECVFSHKLEQRGCSDQYTVASAATSREEIGNPIHPGTQNKLREMGVPILPHRAVQMRKSDYERYDYLIGMDDWNLQNMRRIVGGDPEHKLYKLLDFTPRGGDIADPWYTGNFDETYRDIDEGCDGLLRTMLKGANP